MRFAGLGEWSLSGSEGEPQSLFINGELVAKVCRMREGVWRWRLSHRCAWSHADSLEEAVQSAWKAWYFREANVEEGVTSAQAS